MKRREFQNVEENYSGRETLGDLEEARNYNNHLVEIIAEHASGSSKVADFGAGNGQFAAKIRAYCESVVAIEPDFELKNQILRRGVAHTTIEALQNESLDLIYSLNVLEHIADDVAVLKSLRSKLDKEGKLLLYVPAHELLYSNFDYRIGHYRRYSKRGLRTTLEEAGFKVEKIEFYDPIGFFAALVYRLLDNSGNLKTGQIRIFDRYAYPLSRSLQPLTARLFGKNLLAVGKQVS